MGIYLANPEVSKPEGPGFQLVDAIDIQVKVQIMSTGLPIRVLCAVYLISSTVGMPELWNKPRRREIPPPLHCFHS